ncbi:MAG: hypothetical protein IKU84_05130 [Clostridia bacterium]|nr:hypothetical protein [Clostridia bacterium]
MTKEKVLKTQDGELIKVRYQIITTKHGGYDSYGLAITSFGKTKNLDKIVEIADITQKFIEINTLLMVLYNYEVTPTTLYDVLDVCLADLDYLSSIVN